MKPELYDLPLDSKKARKITTVVILRTRNSKQMSWPAKSKMIAYETKNIFNQYIRLSM